MATVRTVIAGKTWTLRFVRSITHDGVKCDGLCDFEKREIRVLSSLNGQELVDTVIHEIMHAAGWNLHEEFVAQTAEDIAGALYHPEVRGRI